MILFCASAAVLSGCVATMPQQAVRPTANDDPSVSCYDWLNKRDTWAPLRSKIAVGVPADRVPLEMLADKSGPTEPELKLISQFKAERDTCEEVGVSFRSQYASTEFRINRASDMAALNSLFAKLYAREITYGEFNRLRSEVTTNARTANIRTSQQEREQLARQASEREAAALNALQNFQMQQQLRNQQSRPITTTCSRFGSDVNCITR